MAQTPLHFAPFTVILPMPPSANNLYPTNWTTKKRFQSVEYRKWLAWASQLVTRPRFVMDGRLYAKYEFQFSNNRRTDIAGREKAISDFLVKRGVIQDDSLIDHMELIRLPKGEQEFAKITIKQMEGV